MFAANARSGTGVLRQRWVIHFRFANVSKSGRLAM